jgi:SAM-dependent methyltransferase
VLDCGKSLREYYTEVKSKGAKVLTIDLNTFDNYPDYQADICDTSSMNDLDLKFNYVICFSLLEHCYDPFSAAKNLFHALAPNGKIYGSAPFLCPHHGPIDLSYPDYFRFTRDSYALLFPDARKITLYPLRGRLGTSLVVFTLKYRFNFERRFPNIANRVNQLVSKSRNQLQSSGFAFVIEN